MKEKDFIKKDDRIYYIHFIASLSDQYIICSVFDIKTNAYFKSMTFLRSSLQVLDMYDVIYEVDFNDVKSFFIDNIFIPGSLRQSVYHSPFKVPDSYVLISQPFKHTKCLFLRDTNDSDNGHTVFIKHSEPITPISMEANKPDYVDKYVKCIKNVEHTYSQPRALRGKWYQFTSSEKFISEIGKDYYISNNKDQYFDFSVVLDYEPLNNYLNKYIKCIKDLRFGDKISAIKGKWYKFITFDSFISENNSNHGIIGKSKYEHFDFSSALHNPPVNKEEMKTINEVHTEFPFFIKNTSISYSFAIVLKKENDQVICINSCGNIDTINIKDLVHFEKTTLREVITSLYDIRRFLDGLKKYLFPKTGKYNCSFKHEGSMRGIIINFVYENHIIVYKNDTHNLFLIDRFTHEVILQITQPNQWFQIELLEEKATDNPKFIPRCQLKNLL